MSEQEFKGKQWVLWVKKDDETGEMEDFKMFNPDPEGKGVEYFYSLIPGKYGEPLIYLEATLAFPPPENLQYVDTKGQTVVPQERISGIVCQKGPRFSLSSAYKQNVEVFVRDDGSLQIGDMVWWFATLFLKDKNRFKGYDAYCIKEQPKAVCVLELGDLDLFHLT